MLFVVGGSCQCGGMICLGLERKKFDMALSKTGHPFWMQHPNIKIGFTIIAIEKINANGKQWSLM